VHVSIVQLSIKNCNCWDNTLEKNMDPSAQFDPLLAVDCTLMSIFFINQMLAPSSFRPSCINFWDE
jgi:hypothetical protein